MGITLEGLLNSKKHDELDPDNLDGEDFMKKGDPVVCLIRSSCGRGDGISVWQREGYKDNSKIDDLEDADKQVK